MGLVLFVAELGGGFGHVRRLLPVARAAAAEGHRPLFLTGNPDEVRGLLDEAGFEVGAAPTAVRRAPVPPAAPVATSFADILGGLGFAEVDYLREVTDAWETLLANLRPMAVVCELSPFLCLAALRMDLPVLVLGYGFVLPPPHLSRFPRLLPGPPSYSEERLLETVAAACRARATRAPDALPSLFAGSAHAVTGLALLDPYRALREKPAVGPIALDVEAELSAPTEDLFAYLLGDAAPTLEALRALAESGVRGRVFVRRATEAHRRVLAGSNATLLDVPEPTKQALSRARIVLHHGSMLLTEETIAAGRPQVVVPLYLEHLLTAGVLRALGASSVVPATSIRTQLVRVLRDAVIDGALTETARKIAASFWRTMAPPGDLPATLLGTISDQLRARLS